MAPAAPHRLHSIMPVPLAGMKARCDKRFISSNTAASCTSNSHFLTSPSSTSTPTFLGPVFDAIIPVPLHRERLMQREFNQATMLARGLAHHLHAPVLERLLVRVRSTRPQVELSGSERRQNVKQAFAVTHAAALEDKRVLVVDDVFTTGATLGEIARTLKVAGATQVDVFALARVVRD